MAAAAAIVIGHRGKTSPDEMKKILTSSAKYLGSRAEYGAGLLQVHDALVYASTSNNTQQHVLKHRAITFPSYSSPPSLLPRSTLSTTITCHTLQHRTAMAQLQCAHPACLQRPLPCLGPARPSSADPRGR